VKKSTIENYIKQTVEFIKEDALVAKEDYLSSKNSNSRLFRDGVLMGYYYVITLLKQQAEAFDINTNDLNLDNIDPDKDLIISHADDTKISHKKKPDKNSENNTKINILNGRIRHLENEIKNFEKQIKDLSNKN
jgi:hypothetical protein